MRFSYEQKQEMARRYKRGASQTDIGRQMGIHGASVGKVLRRLGVKCRDTPKSVTAAERDEIVDLYHQGLSVRVIGSRIGRPYQTVYNIIRETGIARSPGEGRRATTPQETRDKAVKLYNSGKSLHEVAEALDITSQIVYGELKRRGIACRPAGRKTRFADDPETANAILVGYKNGCSVPLLAHVYECSRDAVKQVLKDANVSLRKDSPGSRVHQYIDRKGREHWMRSSWEIRTAMWLDREGRNWDYEKETYEINARKHYTPDFWIYDDSGELEILLEVKGWLQPKCDARMELFREAYPGLPLELWTQKELTNHGILELRITEPPKGRKRVRGSGSRISKEEIQEAIRLYETGMSVGQVAKALKRSESGIARKLQVLGKTRNRYETKKLLSADQDTRDLIAQTYLDGLSMSKTAKKLGLSRDIVAGEIKSRGLSRTRSRARLLNTQQVS